jgi:ketol-acid reductoisomerase
MRPTKTFFEYVSIPSISWKVHCDRCVYQGGRDKYALVKQAFEGIKQIGVIGWGSQAPAQAQVVHTWILFVTELVSDDSKFGQNLRDTLAEIKSDTKVVIGLRETSPSWNAAKIVGFTEVLKSASFNCNGSCHDAQAMQADGTLQAQDKVIRESDLVMLLISDAAQANDYKKKIGVEFCNIQMMFYFIEIHSAIIAFRAAPEEGCYSGPVTWFPPRASREIFSFSASYRMYWISTLVQESLGETFRSDINVILIAPKGMGPSVRRLYEQVPTKIIQ